jgi:hypothetical protein
MHLKIKLSSRGLTLSISEPDYRVCGHHFFGKLIPTLAFGHGAFSGKSRVHPVSLLENKTEFDIVQLADTGKRPSSYDNIFSLRVK